MKVSKAKVEASAHHSLHTDVCFCCRTRSEGRHFHLGVASFAATGAVNSLCRTLKKDPFFLRKDNFTRLDVTSLRFALATSLVSLERFP